MKTYRLSPLATCSWIVTFALLSFGVFAFIADAQTETNEEINTEVIESDTASSDFFEPDETVVTPPSIDLLEEETTTSTEPVVEEAATSSSDAEAPPLGESEPSDEPESVEAPTLSTDKEEYAPEETATIFGKFFAPLKNIVLRFVAGSLLEPEETYFEDTATVTTDEEGSFSFDYELSHIFAPLYRIFAEDEEGNVVAEGSFIDPLQTSFTQCANDDPAGCDWIGSIIQQSNSVYYEGMTVPQRLLFRDAAIVNGNHTISFTYQYTKAGIHAYDFLTTVNPKLGIAQGNGSFTPGTPNLNPCGGLNGQDESTCLALNPSSATPIQIPIPNDAFDSKDAGPTGQTDKENAFEALTSLDRYISAYVRGGTITFGTPTLVHSPAGANSDSGDTEVTITIPFTSNGCVQTQQSDCDILLYFGGHLAVTGDGTAESWGPGLGSSQISGGPYHIKSVKFDGTGGSQDNQIKGADILLPPAALGNIIIQKETLPDGDPTDFTFNPSWSDTNFTLSDGEQLDSGDLDAGTYSVAEVVPEGWDLTSAVCDDGSPVNAIELADEETVTCTFTNTKQGSITVVKEIVGTNKDFSFTDDITASLGDGESETVSVAPGSYTVTEGADAAYDLTSIVCDDGDSTSDINTRTATFNVAAGENVTCTFTNSELPTLTLVKTVENDNGGTADADDFQGYIDGEAVAWETAETLSPGSYTASEDGVTGYTASDWGDDCAADGSVTLAYGEHKTCTITNDDNAPSLTLVKVVVNDNGGSAATTDWTLTADGPTPISGSGGVTSGATFSAGSYDLSESAGPGGYSASDWVCEGGEQDGASITLGLGDSATCTITNDDEQAYVTVVKVVTNDNGGSADPSDFALTLEGDSVTSGVQVPVDPGTYTAAETQLPGYTFEGFTGDCDSNGDVTVALGESKTCTLTNNDQQAYVTVVKVVNNTFGGTAAPDDFDLTLEGNAVSSGVAVPVNPGTYTAAETLADGYEFDGFSGQCDGNGDVTVALGESKTCTLTNSDLPASLSGMKFDDKNGNGVKDEGDTGLADWTIFIDENGNGELDGDEPSTTTDVNGAYSFTGLSVGTYTVREEQQTGWTQTTTNPADIELENGENVTNVDFGNFKLVSITGKKFNDDEGDGAITGDATLPGWTIRLYKVVSDVWTLVDTQDTDGTGSYSFNNLGVGSYRTCEVLEDGWIQTFSSTGSANASPSSSEEGEECNTRNVTTSGVNPSAGNFGNYEAKALTVEKTAATTFTRTFAWTIDKSVTPSALDLFLGDSADVDYTVAVTKDDGTDSAFAVTGTITITNPNPASTGLDTEVSVTDVMTGDIEADVVCADTLVPAGGSIECTYSANLPNSDARTNTATVETEGIVEGGSDDAAVTFDLANPTLKVLDSINVTDTNGDSWQFSDDGSEEYPDTFTCNADEGEHNNTVTIEETDQTDTATVTVACHELEVSKTAETSYIRTFDWDITKTVDQEVVDLFTGSEDTVEYTVVATKGEGVDSDFKVEGTITVNNPAPIDATLNSVSDAVGGVGPMTVDCGVEFPYELAAGGTLECTYSGDLTDKEDRTNTATATLQNTPSGTTDFTGTANVTFGEPTTLVNDTVTVTDTYEGSTVDAVSETTEFNYERDFACYADEGNGTGEGEYPNTAAITETGDSDDASVEVNCYDLTVAKDADTSYTKTWTWTVDKTSTTSELTLAPGQVYPVNYEVTVDATSADSDHAVSGTITITNPAPIDATLTDVSDVITDGINAEVDCSTLVVPANGSIECTYTADLPNADTRTNTASVTLENGTSYSGNASVDFANAEVNEVDESIDLTDDKYGALGTIAASEVPKTFEYTLNVGPYEGETLCGTTQEFDNTATLTTNDTGATGSDMWTVEAAIACTCSLTQGYWKTHNDTFHGGAPADENWFNLGPLGELSGFFTTDVLTSKPMVGPNAPTLTWYTVFWTAPKGNVYYNMAHQYMAAKLNVLNGAYNPTINTSLAQAELLLKTYTPAQIQALKGKNATVVSKEFQTLAGIFAAFNEGTTNPAGHCSEIPQ